MPESATTSNAGTGTATPIAEADEKEDAEGEGEGEGEGDGELPDTDERSVAGTRPPNAGDGIPELETLIELAKQLLPDRGLQSAYTAEKWTQGDEATFAKRDGFVRSFEGRAVPDGLSGLNEPAYTCYTPLFKLTLGERRFWSSSGHGLTARLLASPPVPFRTSHAAASPGHSRAVGRGLAEERHLRQRPYCGGLRDRVVSAWSVNDRMRGDGYSTSSQVEVSHR